MTPEQRALDVVSDWSIDPDVIYPRVLAAIREAVAAERERCAKIVEAEEGDTQYYPDEYGGERGETVYDMATLAAKIRKG